MIMFCALNDLYLKKKMLPHHILNTILDSVYFFILKLFLFVFSYYLM